MVEENNRSFFPAFLFFCWTFQLDSIYKDVRFHVTATHEIDNWDHQINSL